MRFSTPPRSVPLSLRIANLLDGSALLGWFIFGFGMLFFWTMVMHSVFSYLNFRGEKRIADGRITSVEATKHRESKRTVHAHHYDYSVDGRAFQSVSYTTGSPSEPRPVRVEYLVEDPKNSRIIGMRPAIFSWAAQFLTIIPLTGLLLMFFGTRRGMRRIHLLENGLFATGTLVDKRATNVSERKRTVYELAFEFTGRDGRKHLAKARSSHPERLEDEKLEPLLYDSANPERSYLLDEIPARPQFDAEGELTGKTSYGALVIPVVVILENLLFAFRSAAA